MNIFRQVTFILVLTLGSYLSGSAQVNEEFSSALDSARALEDNKKDSVVFTAKYIRYTTLAMMKQSTRTVALDTSHVNFQYYNPQNRPWNPSINLGSYGLATRDLLFNPNKTIGFQSGFHAFERYIVDPDSIRYFRARARYSELSAVGFFFNDQVFRALLAQNITPQWNLGASYYATNTDGYYVNQDYNDRKGNLFSWYESKNKRYNLLVNVSFNRLSAAENGAVVNDTVFRDTSGTSNMGYATRLRGTNADRPNNKWTDNSAFIRQSFYIGRLDTLNAGTPEMEIRPTNSFAHNSSIRQQKYMFYKNEVDLQGAFPYGDVRKVDDTTSITTVSNEFTYGFYLRGKGLFKNQAKLNLGFQNDLIWYTDSLGRDSVKNRFYQNSMVKGALGYQFSDRVTIDANVKQVVLGRNAGDFLYEASADINFSERLGKLSVGAYTQNKSPEMAFERMQYTFHTWNQSFEKSKTQNLSFAYTNKFLGFSGRVDYFLMDKYLYFREVANPGNLETLRKVIMPTQHDTSINLLKITIGQNFKFRRFHLDNIVVYQKSDFNDILSIPELYSWHSLYYANMLYKVMDYRIGFDMKFNTPFRAPSYAINASQFYYDNVGTEFSTYPIVDVWATANIRRVNLFISYNFVNQFIAPKGYYTVRRYPMNDANIRFGVSWKFYD